LIEPNDEVLIQRSLRGDGSAFVTLVKRYEQALATLIRYHIGNAEDAEDVFQEMLLHAWVSLFQLRDPRKVRAWLLQIARNRCRDYQKSSQRRDLPTDEQEMEIHINQFGRAAAQQRDIVNDLVGTLEDAPERERSIVKMFYLQGLTIAEISEQSGSPEGTVKRSLHHARESIRHSLGMPKEAQRRFQVAKHRPGSKRQPFPVRRPKIVISESEVKEFPVDHQELPWWFGVPKIGRARRSLEHWNRR